MGLGQKVLDLLRRLHVLRKQAHAAHGKPLQRGAKLRRRRKPARLARKLLRTHHEQLAHALLQAHVGQKLRRRLCLRRARRVAQNARRGDKKQWKKKWTRERKSRALATRFALRARTRQGRQERSRRLQALRALRCSSVLASYQRNSQQALSCISCASLPKEPGRPDHGQPSHEHGSRSNKERTPSGVKARGPQITARTQRRLGLRLTNPRETQALAHGERHRASPGNQMRIQDKCSIRLPRLAEPRARVRQADLW